MHVHHVLLAIAGLREELVAHKALEWLKSGMPSQMILKVTRLSKLAATTSYDASVADSQSLRH